MAAALDCLKFSGNVRLAYYHPQFRKVRQIYSTGWLDYQLEAAATRGRNWQVWTGVSGFAQNGHSIGLHDKTCLQLIPVSLGFKYLFCWDSDIKLYLGAGTTYSFLKIRDHSAYVHEHINKQALGAIVQTGLYFDLNRCLFANLFLDYFYQKFRFSDSHHDSCSPYVERHDLNLSGFKIGAGIGAYF